MAHVLLLVSIGCSEYSLRLRLLTLDRGSNIIVSSTFLSMMKSLTPSGAFGFYAAICGIGWVLIILFYPEVSGLTLEEVRPSSELDVSLTLPNKLSDRRCVPARVRRPVCSQPPEGAEGGDSRADEDYGEAAGHALSSHAPARACMDM